jgi:DnaJ-class molecular chaperone
VTTIEQAFPPLSGSGPVSVQCAKCGGTGVEHLMAGGLCKPFDCEECGGKGKVPRG